MTNLTRTISPRGTILTLLGLAALSCLPVSAAPVYSFYTGDPDLPSSGLTNIVNPVGVSGFNGGNPYFADVYQSFVVPAGGWTVQDVFANDAMDFTTTTADWEIRTGMSGGDGGTLLASGSSAASQTSTGFTASNSLTIYTVEVSGLSVTLGPGTYWLAVAPVGSPDSGIVGTNGANSVDAASTSAIDNFPADGANFFAGPTSGDGTVFSMGLGAVSDASPAPEPGALPLAAISLALLSACLVPRICKPRED